MFFCNFIVVNQNINKKTITPMTTANLVEIFCIMDEFCKFFDPELKKHILSDGKRHRNRPCSCKHGIALT